MKLSNKITNYLTSKLEFAFLTPCIRVCNKSARNCLYDITTRDKRMNKRHNAFVLEFDTFGRANTYCLVRAFITFCEWRFSQVNFTDKFNASFSLKILRDILTTLSKGSNNFVRTIAQSEQNVYMY